MSAIPDIPRWKIFVAALDVASDYAVKPYPGGRSGPQPASDLRDFDGVAVSVVSRVYDAGTIPF
jgi:hypothetical protein